MHWNKFECSPFRETMAFENNPSTLYVQVLQFLVAVMRLPIPLGILFHQAVDGAH